MKLELLNKFNLKEFTQNKGIKPLIIVLICCAIALIMSSNDTIGINKKTQKISNEKNIQKDNDTEYRMELENDLRNMIVKVNGVNDATVMLTLKSSTEKVVLKDSPYSKEGTKEEQVYSSEEETVLVEDIEGNAQPYIVKKINPEVEGVVVGIKTQSDNVEQEIMDIVQALFDIPVHKIKIVNIN